MPTQHRDEPPPAVTSDGFSSQQSAVKPFLEGVQMPIVLHGNTYEFVAERMASLHRDHGDDYDLDTVKLVDDPDTGRVEMKTSITLYQTKRDGVWVPIPAGRTKTGMAEEMRNSSNITTTSAIEVCETSSIGRALAACGYHPDGTYASADEMQHAIAQQDQDKNQLAELAGQNPQKPQEQIRQVAGRASDPVRSSTTTGRGIVNKYRKKCVVCDKWVEAGDGWSTMVADGKWETRCNETGECVPIEAPTGAQAAESQTPVVVPDELALNPPQPNFADDVDGLPF